MLLMMQGRFEPMLQWSLRYDGMHVCSSELHVLRKLAVCSMIVHDSHAKSYALCAGHLCFPHGMVLMCCAVSLAWSA